MMFPVLDRVVFPDAWVSLVYSAPTYERLFARIGKGGILRRPKPLCAARHKQNATHQSVKLMIHVQIGKISFVPSRDDFFFLPSHILDSLLCKGEMFHLTNPDPCYVELRVRGSFVHRLLLFDLGGLSAYETAVVYCTGANEVRSMSLFLFGQVIGNL